MTAQDGQEPPEGEPEPKTKRHMHRRKTTTRYKKEAQRDRKILRLITRGCSDREIAKASDCSLATVQRRKVALRKYFSEIGNVEQFRTNKLDILDAVQLKFLKTAMQPEKLKKASLSNLMYGYSQVAQQSRLERGQPTDIQVQARFCKPDKTIEIISNSKETKTHENNNSQHISDAPLLPDATQPVTMQQQPAGEAVPVSPLPASERKE